MNTDKSLQKAPTQAVETKAEERTQQFKYFRPDTDIFETTEALHVQMDLPGVTKDRVKVTMEKNRLTVEGEIDPKRYEPLKAVYAEYNLGHFSRSFQVSNQIDPQKIEAKMDQGVLYLTLHKRPEEKPHQIKVA
ncbi:MAG: Hsp20/alpha crystallin family protein [bacterium]|nr:Hsp20/alpha crystallin family protein [bacterium]